jgi:hypothetical protein
MADEEEFEVGFGKPPKRSQFKKGQSGNPKGRPKGSQNMATIFEKIVRQKVTITENGRSRVVSKAEAMFLQMVNKGLKGDVSAIHEIRYWSQRFEDFAKEVMPNRAWHEDDQVVMDSIIKRMQLAKLLEPENGMNPEMETQRQGKN